MVLEDNLLIGHVQVGGDGDPLAWEEADQSGVAIPGGNLVVGLRGGTLELRGNQLLGLRVDKTALNNRTPPPQREKAETLEGTFRFCTLTDNRFALPGSVVFAANLRVASNQFEYPDDPPGHLLALVGLTRSATAVGNVVGQVRLADPDTGEIPLINIYVSNGRGREAANVPRVRIV